MAPACRGGGGATRMDQQKGGMWMPRISWVRWLRPLASGQCLASAPFLLPSSLLGGACLPVCQSVTLSVCLLDVPDVVRFAGR